MRAGASYFLRPVRASDVDGLYALARVSSGGLSSLQPDKDYLAGYIAGSLESFAALGEPVKRDKTRKYLLVMEDVDSGAVIGCAAVKTHIGGQGEPPFINFDLSTDGKMLTASDRFAGATEVGSLFLHPDHRAGGLGRYLAKSRYLMMACAPEQFSQTVIAELRGVSKGGKAPFYDAVFAARLGLSFLDADASFASCEEKALALITPEAPVKVESLSREARRVMGQAHPSGMGAMVLLQREGFRDSRTVDLFDGGPIVVAYRDQITTLQESRLCTLSSQDVPHDAQLYLIAAGGLADFRCMVTPASRERNTVCLLKAAAKLLDVKAGDPLRVWTEGQRINPAAKARAQEKVQISVKAKDHV